MALVNDNCFEVVRHQKGSENGYFDFKDMKIGVRSDVEPYKRLRPCPRTGPRTPPRPTSITATVTGRRSRSRSSQSLTLLRRVGSRYQRIKSQSGLEYR